MSAQHGQPPATRIRNQGEGICTPSQLLARLKDIGTFYVRVMRGSAVCLLKTLVLGITNTT
jgi:hypothetical protein